MFSRFKYTYVEYLLISIICKLIEVYSILSLYRIDHTFICQTGQLLKYIIFYFDCLSTPQSQTWNLLFSICPKSPNSFLTGSYNYLSVKKKPKLNWKIKNLPQIIS